MLQEDAESGHAVDLELCKLYIAAEQWDLALGYGLKEFQKRPKNMDVNHALAWVYFKQKNLKKAQEHITTALKTGSKDPELLQKASAIALSTGNTIESNRLASIAKKINPQFTL
jgi:Tfp pilus assembly protein PilF